MVVKALMPLETKFKLPLGGSSMLESIQPVTRRHIFEIESKLLLTRFSCVLKVACKVLTGSSTLVWLPAAILGVSQSVKRIWLLFNMVLYLIPNCLKVRSFLSISDGSAFEEGILSPTSSETGQTCVGPVSTFYGNTCLSFGRLLGIMLVRSSKVAGGWVLMHLDHLGPFRLFWLAHCLMWRQHHKPWRESFPHPGIAPSRLSWELLTQQAASPWCGPAGG